MSGNPFQPATREAAKARIALCGPSGSGKTYTALVLASNLGSKVAVVDTEHGSAAKYATTAETPEPGRFRFDNQCPVRFDPRELSKTLAQAAEHGYDVVVVDSLSHYWFGPGGVLELVDEAAKRARGNSFAGWKDVRPYERQIIASLLGYPGHVIVTMRTKTEWVVEEDERGRKQPRKVGTRPEQRDGIEYEFDIVGDLDQDNTLVISKSRCFELSGAVVRKPGPDLAKQVRAWLDDGVSLPTAIEYRDRALDSGTTFEQLGDMYREVERRQMGDVLLLNEAGDDEALGSIIRRIGKDRMPTKSAPAEAAS